ncbi:unnamed protein product, partial [Allacma fusca]
MPLSQLTPRRQDDDPLDLDTISSLTSATFADTKFNLADIIRTLKTLGETPVLKTHTYHPKTIRGKLANSTLVLKSKLQSVTKGRGQLTPRKDGSSRAMRGLRDAIRIRTAGGTKQ